ncbi:MAG: hypothetical protein JW917_11465 [Ignavibacteria bacterium]|nr:hypothetical protein [Ignavibacteria bacterium]
MKKYIIILILIFFPAGIYYVSGFDDAFKGEETRDTIINARSGVSNEVTVPTVKNTEEKEYPDCSSKYRRKCCVKEVPLGENPYLNNPDTATNRITPQEEK